MKTAGAAPDTASAAVVAEGEADRIVKGPATGDDSKLDFRVVGGGGRSCSSLAWGFLSLSKRVFL